MVWVCGEVWVLLFEVIVCDCEVGGRVWVSAFWLRRFGGFVVGLFGEFM